MSAHDTHSGTDRRLTTAGTFGRKVAVLAGGSAFAQGLVLLAMPVITVLYGADQFGALAVFASIVGILSRIGALGYDMAIPLPRETVAAANLLVLSFAILLALTGACAFIVWRWPDPIVTWTGGGTLRPFLWLIPIGLLIGGTFSPLNYWAIRHGAYPDMARARVAQALGMAVTQIVAGIAGAGTLGLLAGEMTGRALASGRLARRMLRGSGPMLAAVSPRGVAQVAARFRKFPQFSSWGILMNAASANLPPLLFAPLYGIEVTGWLALTQRVLGAPSELIAQSVSQVYFVAAADEAHAGTDSLRRLYVRLSRSLFAAGLVPAAVLAVFGPTLFALLFGAAWTESGIYARALAAMLVARCVIGPLGARTLQVLERQGLLLAWEAVRFLLLVASIALAWGAGASAAGAVTAYAAAMVAAYLALYATGLHALRHSARMETSGADAHSTPERSAT
jgi:O-antigen/teichoic acid export membrane protein